MFYVSFEYSNSLNNEKNSVSLEKYQHFGIHIAIYGNI